MIKEILILGALCAGWALLGLLARRWGHAEPGRCRGCRGGECRKACETTVAVLALVLLAGCGVPPGGFSTFTFDTMGTKLTVTVPAGARAAEDAEAVAEVFRGVDARMSEWKDTSPLSAVNREAGGVPVPVPADLRAVIRRGIEIGHRTGGAFDLTWAALWGLWDFRAERPRVPSPEDIAARVALVDYRQVEVSDSLGTVRLPRAGMKIGLGGIAKGYALDRARDVLRERGVKDFLVSGGGQLLAGGAKGEEPWRAGIRDPRGGPEEFFATLDLGDESLSTSGDYESFFEVDGRRYHHILDPRTGWPAEAGLRSATVVSPDATLADALSTACMVMGVERTLRVCQDLGAEAVLVDSSGGVHMTPGLKGHAVSSAPAARLSVLRAPRR